GQGCFECGAPFVINPATCECECPDGCAAPLVQNPDTCECSGSECPDGFCSPNCIGPGFQCCGVSCACVDTRDSPNHCGGCGQPCRDPGKRCCDGACVDVRFNDDHCSVSCDPCPAGTECCHGLCLDPRQLVCCRDPGEQGQPWCPANSVCCSAEGCCLP
ncbi:MAG: hypothetical protein ACRDJC_20585, partial [Thermomicrobiales bacterium]